MKWWSKWGALVSAVGTFVMIAVSYVAGVYHRRAKAKAAPVIATYEETVEEAIRRYRSRVKEIEKVERNRDKEAALREFRRRFGGGKQ